MGKQTVRWVADDGKEFNSKADMLLYELGLLDEKEIDLFIEKECAEKSRRKAEYKKLLIKWQGHMRSVEKEIISTPKEEFDPFGGEVDEI